MLKKRNMKKTLNQITKKKQTSCNSLIKILHVYIPAVFKQLPLDYDKWL